MRESLPTEKLREKFDSEVEGPTESEKYQQAASFIRHRQSQDSLNRIIRLGVLRAWRGRANLTDNEVRNLLLDESELRKIETRKGSAWRLNEGAEALGCFLTWLDESMRGPILTTNFDPLLEISVRRSGGGTSTQWMDGDGRIERPDVEDVVEIAHVHGYWRMGNTLHTQGQLTRQRHKLGGSIRERLRGHYVVVCGYGGWQDAFTRSLLDRIQEENALGMDISWAWHGELRESDFNRGMLAELGKLDAISHFGGIDINTLFPELYADLPGTCKRLTIGPGGALSA
ncbi:SIR2 family protein [Streptomyces sp. NPDC059373]